MNQYINHIGLKVSICNGLRQRLQQLLDEGGLAQAAGHVQRRVAVAVGEMRIGALLQEPLRLRVTQSNITSTSTSYTYYINIYIIWIGITYTYLDVSHLRIRCIHL